AETFSKRGIKMVSGGTDNHLILVNLIGTGVSGKDLETMLDKVHITVNKNAIPFDPEKPNITSGIRVGTASLTTRGMNEADMAVVANCIADIIFEGESAFDKVKANVKMLCDKHPIYEKDIMF
ncbi:MAG: serine hydroxymethyltransferase, partial [Clostridia bacterium]